MIADRFRFFLHICILKPENRWQINEKKLRRHAIDIPKRIEEDSPLGRQPPPYHHGTFFEPWALSVQKAFKLFLNYQTRSKYFRVL